MKFYPRHIILLIGMVCVILSFLFFGRAQNSYQLILLIGLFFSVLSFAWILWKDKGRIRLMWIGIVIAGILLQVGSEKWLIARSFQILIAKNQALFDQANEIMKSKNDNTLYPGSNNQDKKGIFSDTEIRLLENLRERANVRYIVKDSRKIFYNTYGFLDASGGVTNFYTDSVNNAYTRIRGRWYF